MKLWITHINPQNTIGPIIALTKEQCIHDAEYENLRFAYPYNIITGVQEVEIDSDYLFFILMTRAELHKFNTTVRHLIATKDPAVKFGEIIPLEMA